MKNRRSFIKKSLAGVAAASLITMSKNSEATEISVENSLIHMVYFWLKNPNDVENRAKFEAGIKKLMTVETISMSHVGVPASTEKRDVVDNSFTYSCMVVFNNQKAHDIYQKHPIHLKFIEDCEALWEKVVVYDSLNY